MKGKKRGINDDSDRKPSIQDMRQRKIIAKEGGSENRNTVKPHHITVNCGTQATGCYTDVTRLKDKYIKLYINIHVVK